jgi:uncharacterized protein YdiU (UPF0061 family)
LIWEYISNGLLLSQPLKRGKGSVIYVEESGRLYLLSLGNADIVCLRAKLGLTEAHESDHELASGLTEVLEKHHLDYTSTLRSLSSVARETDSLSDPLLATSEDFSTWGQQWLHRLEQQAGSKTAAADCMDTINRVYIPRNH